MSATEEIADPFTEGFLWYIQRLAAYFYANDGIMSSTRSHWIQQVFDILSDMFYWVGMRTNMGNMVSMECQP